MRMLAVVMAIVSCVGLAYGQIWDAAADWNHPVNPNSAWIYGFQTTLADPFTPYNSGDLFQGGRWQWYDGSPSAGATPGIGQAVEGGYVEGYIPEGKIILHPGPGPDGGPLESNGIKGEYSVLRWIAPAAGLYNISALFEGVNFATCCDLPVTTDVHVLLNGQSEFSGIVNGFIGGAPGILDPDGNILGPQGPAPTQSWQEILDLAAGDTVDFAVGDGENDSYQVDATALTATIVAVPEPSAALSVGMLGLVLAAARQTRFRRD